ncbi:hypothetical protein GQ600_20543 [Phytophthora cactorum]|nr:hypothetical protein GQ600_20543 [Phytophthora cactorum]
MNGFNYEMMATLGKDIADRIYYCCKNVTNQQKQLDSQVAVAVAAFKRRQDREALEASAKPLEATNGVLKVRKRIAAMVCNATNRQEVAGPFAALYLFRGSCYYLSAACVSLHMYNRTR